MAKTTSEIDTREKLEAEVKKWCGGSGYEYQVDMVHDWLDCQAIITAREISNDIAIMETGDMKPIYEDFRVFGISLEEINVLRKRKTELENQLEIQRKRNKHLQEQLYNETKLTNNLREELTKLKSNYYKLRADICELVCDVWSDTE